jgi:hypothetical protein
MVGESGCEMDMAGWVCVAADIAFTPEQHAFFLSTSENPPHLMVLESADQDKDVESHISAKRHLN